jgi:hypothetical protein
MRSPPCSRKAAAVFRPRLEPLEDRCLPAVSISILPGNVLQVLGSNRNDRIQIIDNGSAAENNVVVLADRTEFIPGVAVSNVVVRTHGGNDNVVYTQAGALQRNITRFVNVFLGSGTDRFHAQLPGGLVTGSSLTIDVHGGSGSDNESIGGGGDIAAGAALTVILDGGLAGSTITTTYQAQVKGNLIVFAAGGPSDDVLHGVYTLNTGSTGALSAQFQGGFGDDHFFLNVRQISLLDRVSINAAVDGGPGNNTAIVSSNVSIVRTPFKTVL